MMFVLEYVKALQVLSLLHVWPQSVSEGQPFSKKLSACYAMLSSNQA
jgi:hypothetical protein